MSLIGVKTPRMQRGPTGVRALAIDRGVRLLLVFSVAVFTLVSGCRVFDSPQQSAARRFFKPRIGVADTWSRRHFAIGGTLRRSLGADNLPASAAVLIAWEFLEPRFAPGESRTNQISDIAFGLAGWGLAPTPGQAVHIEAFVGRDVPALQSSPTLTVSESP